MKSYTITSSLCITLTDYSIKLEIFSCIHKLEQWFSFWLIFYETFWTFLNRRTKKHIIHVFQNEKWWRNNLIFQIGLECAMIVLEHVNELIANVLSSLLRFIIIFRFWSDMNSSQSFGFIKTGFQLKLTVGQRGVSSIKLEKSIVENSETCIFESHISKWID